MTTIDADEQDAALLNRLIPPRAGQQFGGGRHVQIPEDWQQRIAAGERVPGCRYFAVDQEESRRVLHVPDNMRDAVREALGRTQRPEDVERAAALRQKIPTRTEPPEPDREPLGRGTGTGRP